MSVFYDNFVGLCAKFDKAPSKVARDIGLSNAAATTWKNGKQPSEVTLIKLANYFSVSVAELTKEAAEKEKKTTLQAESEVDKEMFALWKSAGEEERRLVLRVLRAYREEGEINGNS